MDFTNFSPALVLVTVVALALAPFVAVMVTSFTKIVVVLSLLRNALGLQQVPPNVVINGLAIVLSIYVMYPVILDTTAAVNGLPPVSASGAAANARAASGPSTPPPATTAAAPAAVSPAAPASTGPTAPATRAATPTPPPDASGAGRNSTNPADLPPMSPAAADAQAAEAAAQTRGPLFANVTGTPGAQPAPAGATTPAAPGTVPAQAGATGTATPAPNANPLSTGARSTVLVPAPATPISELSLLGGGELNMQRLMVMFDAGKEPLRRFLIAHSSDAERAFFLRSAQRLLPPASRGEISADDFIVVIPAFTVSELTAAFQIGFLIYLPFLIIDLVVSNLLLALGMMMMSPTTVSLPFKLLLFVLIDGWAKLVHGLVLTYGV